jgi:hypothetical protein
MLKPFGKQGKGFSAEEAKLSPHSERLVKATSDSANSFHLFRWLIFSVTYLR